MSNDTGQKTPAVHGGEYVRFKAKVREQKSNLGKKPFGRITSIDLAKFIGKDVEVTVIEAITN